jgi:site-specific recombinase XerD
MKNASIREVVSGTMAALQSLGISPRSIWYEHGRTFLPIINEHELAGKEDFDREIITGRVKAIEARYENGEMSFDNYRNAKRAVQRLTEFHDTGKLEWSAPKRTSRFVLSDYYEKILTDFVSSENVSKKVKSDIVWVGRKYFSWLIEKGHKDLGLTGADEVQNFMIFCSRHMVGSGLYNVQLYMRKLYRYLAETEYVAEAYNSLLSMHILRESKLYPAASPGEVSQTLDLIDRRTPKGKRDYAMVLLGVATGLRAIDIARMKLTDIDWQKGEVKIVQSKTKKSVALPLTCDVGEAVSEYILKARPKTNYDNIFIGVRPPYQPFSNGVAVGYIYDSYRKKAGLPRDAYDGKGFHSLRRYVGKNLITSGATVEMTAQILGDSAIESTKKYIALDSEHLRECALDFVGIKPKRGVMSL